LACRAVALREGGSILPMLFGAALGFGLSAPAWLALLIRAWFFPRTNATGRRRIGNGSSLARAARIHFAVLDSELGRLLNPLSATQRD